MKFLFALFLALLAETLPTCAAPIVVKSGEHETFTRLVMTLEQSAQWDATQVPQGIEIVFERGIFDFDLSEAFTRISRGIVRSITVLPGGRGLFVQTNCDCDFSTASSQDRLAVIDISRPQESQNRLKNATNIAKSERASNTDPILPIVFSIDLPRQDNEIEHSSDVELNTPPGDRKDALHQKTLGDVEGRILRQIADAATRGLLETNPRMQQNIRATESLSNGAGATNPMPQDSHSNGSVAHEEIRVKQNECVDLDVLELENWPYTGRFDSDITPLRAELYGAVDQLVPDVASNLAQAYILYGFTAEARQILSLIEEKSPTETELLGLSFLIDLIEFGSHQTNIAPLPCSAQQNIWNLAALSGRASVDLIEPMPLLKEFTALSRELKSILLPGIERTLVRSDQNDLLNAMKAQVGLLESTESIGMEEMGDSSLPKTSEGTHDPNARQQLVIDGNHAAERIAASMKANAAQGTKTDEALIQLADSYVTENRDNEMGAELTEAKILALAANSQFDEAFDTLTLLADNERFSRTQGRVLSFLAEVPDDLVFLEHALNLSKRPSVDLNEEMSVQMASRAFNLGLPKTAHDFLSPYQSDSRLQDTKILLARIALDQLKPRKAELDIADVSTPDAIKLLAQAKTVAGDYQGAFSLFTEVGANSEAEKAAWRAGNWASLNDSSNKALSDLARLAQTQDDAQKTELTALRPSLRAAKDTLTASASLRESLSKALETIGKVE